jgi:phosphoribosylamine--glycine ligase
MGAVSPATNLSLDSHKEIMNEIVRPTIVAMAAEGRVFRGVLYVGLMLTAEGPKVLEYNARFGDPETQVIMARMRSDIVPILAGVANGQMPETKIEWAKEPAVCVVLASQGYPDAIETGKAVEGLADVKGERDTVVFHAATGLRNGRVVTVGGRVLGVTALGPSLDAAMQRAYGAVEKIRFEGMQFRRDIGLRALARIHGAS